MELKYNYQLPGWHVFVVDGPSAVSTRHASVSFQPHGKGFLENVQISLHFQLIKDEDAMFIIASVSELTKKLIELVESMMGYGAAGYTLDKAQVVITSGFVNTHRDVFVDEWKGPGSYDTSKPLEVDLVGLGIATNDAEIVEDGTKMIREDLPTVDGPLGIPVHAEQLPPMIERAGLVDRLPDGQDPLDHITPAQANMWRTYPGRVLLVVTAGNKLAAEAGFSSGWVGTVVPVLERDASVGDEDEGNQFIVGNVGTSPVNETYAYERQSDGSLKLTTPGVFISTWMRRNALKRLKDWDAFPLEWYPTESKSGLGIGFVPKPAGEPLLYGDASALVDVPGVGKVAIGELAPPLKVKPTSTEVHSDFVLVNGHEIFRVFEDDSVHIPPTSPLAKILGEALVDYANHDTDLHYVVYHMGDDKFGVVETSNRAINEAKRDGVNSVEVATDLEKKKYVFTKPAFRAGLMLRRPEAEPLRVPKPRQILNSSKQS